MKTLLKNGRVWIDDSADNHTWVGIQDSTILAVGSQLSTDDEASYDKVVDLAGKLVLPGLQDSHLHILMLGEMLENVNLSGTTTVAAILTLVEARAASAAPDTWLVGIHWDHEKIAEGRPPTRQELDAICPNAYVLLYRSCYHVAVVNTKTLLLLGIPLDEDPSVLQALNVAASTVEYHDGSASGLLKEEATYLARAAQSKQITVADRERCIKRGLQEALCCGLTAVQPNDEQAWGVYKGLHARNELPIRVHLTQPYVELQDWDADKPVEPPFKACSTADDMLRCERIKLFADGSLGASTAALRLPYRCGAHGHGILNHSQETFNSLVQRSHAAGFQLEIHVIGDAAAEAALVALESAQVSAEDRPILTHCQVLGPDLIPRMAKVGAIANIQPTFLVTDAAWLHKRLDASVLPYCYAWKSLQQGGVACAGGSDSPIETVNPFKGMYDVIYRNSGHQGSEPCFLPDEAYTFRQALDLYTQGGAFAGRSETRRGQIAVGFDADLTVVGEAVDKHPELLCTVKPAQVWVHGIERLATVLV